MKPGATFRLNTNLQQLHDDIIKTCEISEAPYNSEAIWGVLNPYQDLFKGATISFRTTTKSKRAVNVRYVELIVPHDPFRTALQAGLIKKEGHPVENLIPEIQAQFTMDGWAGYGVDFGANNGLEKIWTFFNGSQPIEEVYQLPSLPDSVKAHADYFAKYNLNDVRLIGMDYRNKSVNIYFFASEIKGFSPDVVVGMCKDLGFNVPSQELVGYCLQSLPIYYTFTWDSPRAERLCFCAHGMGGEIPVHLHPVIERYVANAPILTPYRPFFFNVTMARDGDFIKIENDYTGAMGPLFGEYVAAPLARLSRNN